MVIKGGTTTLTGSTVSGNSAANGGGLYDYGGTTPLTDCTVSGNYRLGEWWRTGRRWQHDDAEQLHGHRQLPPLREAVCSMTTAAR